MLPQCRHCSAKMLLATYMPPLRITIRGKFPPDNPLFRFQRRLKCDDFYTRAFALRIHPPEEAQNPVSRNTRSIG